MKTVCHIGRLFLFILCFLQQAAGQELRTHDLVLESSANFGMAGGFGMGAGLSNDRHHAAVSAIILPPRHFYQNFWGAGGGLQYDYNFLRRSKWKFIPSFYTSIMYCITNSLSKEIHSGFGQNSVVERYFDQKEFHISTGLGLTCNINRTFSFRTSIGVHAYSWYAYLSSTIVNGTGGPNFSFRNSDVPFFENSGMNGMHIKFTMMARLHHAIKMVKW